MLSSKGVNIEFKEILLNPPSKEEITWFISQQENGAKGLLNPYKVNEPDYVEQITGRENQLSDQDYVNIFHQFPDLFIKPIVTNKVHVVVGFNQEELIKKFVLAIA